MGRKLSWPEKFLADREKNTKQAIKNFDAEMRKTKRGKKK